VSKLSVIKQNAVADGFNSPAVHAALAVLTGRQRAFVLGVMVRELPATVSAINAGYSTGNHVTILMRNPNVLEAIRVMQIEYSKDLELGMSEVQQGLLDAIELGRSTDNAMAMIAGWREIAKLLGLYTEKKEIKLTFEDSSELKDASTRDLLKLVSSDVIEGEIERVKIQES
jgi:hypothetical protein